MDEIRAAFARHDLYRSRDARWLGGVCSGLGARFGFSPAASRILFLVAVVLLPGCPVLAYPVLWALMPRAAADGPTPEGPTTAYA